MCMSYCNPKHHPDTGPSQPLLDQAGNEPLTEGLSGGKEQSWPAGPRLARSGTRLCVGTRRVRKSEPQETQPRQSHPQPESTTDYSLGRMVQVEFSPTPAGEFRWNSVA